MALYVSNVNILPLSSCLVHLLHIPHLLHMPHLCLLHLICLLYLLHFLHCPSFLHCLWLLHHPPHKRWCGQRDLGLGQPLLVPHSTLTDMALWALLPHSWGRRLNRAAVTPPRRGHSRQRHLSVLQLLRSDFRCKIYFLEVDFCWAMASSPSLGLWGFIPRGRRTLGIHAPSLPFLSHHVLSLNSNPASAEIAAGVPCVSWRIPLCCGIVWADLGSPPPASTSCPGKGSWLLTTRDSSLRADTGAAALSAGRAMAPKPRLLGRDS